MQSIPFMASLKTITKIEYQSSWTSPNPTSKDDGHAAAISEYSMDMAEINAQIFWKKICIDMYPINKIDHRKCPFPSLTHLSFKIWLQKSLAVIYKLRWITIPDLKKWQLCTSLINHRWNMLYRQRRW